MFYGAMVLVVVSNVLYHAAQKSVPRAADPLLASAAAYLVALPLAALVWLALWLARPVAEREALADALRQLNWSSVAIGAAILGVEVGFLLAYRAGWNVSLAAAAANAALMVALVPVGVLAFRERLSATNVTGLVLCLAGIVLLTRR
jgi:drug/metabolite transporter (DMT)-like permease